MGESHSFAEILVAQLGAPRETLGLIDILVLCAFALLIGGYLAAEQALARLLVRLVKRVRTIDRSKE